MVGAEKKVRKEWGVKAYRNVLKLSQTEKKSKARLKHS